MYEVKETKISYGYLRDLIKDLDEPICLLGGWAVYFIVSNLFEKEIGYPYLGSRDIDLGFKDIETTKKVMSKLTELGFKKVSFRFFKELHTETMKELSKEEAKKTPLHYIFPLYADLIMAKTDPSIKSKLGFTPIDEPLLKYIFDNKHKKEIKEFGRSVIIPTPSLLLAMKTRSIKGRKDNQKKIKDICDLTSICLYSGIEIETLRQELSSFITKANIKASLDSINKENVEMAAQTLDIKLDVLSDLIGKLKK
ncbi:hypothetical protein KY347_04335 [Candidatus Woesearchaeota archaeon]|nr:hypothetical protein [Candidatus Woesearchaeota archaeon]